MLSSEHEKSCLFKPWLQALISEAAARERQGVKMKARAAARMYYFLVYFLPWRVLRIADHP